MKIYTNLFDQVCSTENLFIAWDIFKRDKRHKHDVICFERNLEQNIFQLYRELINQTYQHGPYKGFYICDPKRRHIHKATVRDRVLHHAIFRILNLVFEPTFITSSFSCRISRGTHRGVDTVEKMIRQVNQNNTRPAYALKCDIKKFFDSVDHRILFSFLQQKITEAKTNWLLWHVIASYQAVEFNERERGKCPGREYQLVTSPRNFLLISISINLISL